MRRWRHLLPLVAGIGGIAVTVALASGRGGEPRVHPLLRAAKGTVSISSSNPGAAVLSASNMAPGETVSGSISILNQGSRPGALQLTPVNLQSPPGPNGGSLADELQLNIQDQTGGGTVFEGPLAAAPVLPLGGIGRNRRRGYLFTVTLPSSAGNEYAAASSRIDLRWTAGALNQKAPCVAEFHGLGPGGLNGTIGGDRITGSPRADRIKGLAGRDCLFGEGGNDHLLGARDEDRLYGGNGDDLLDGGGGTDRLNGGAGSDRIRAGGGTRDIVRCGRGLDRASVDRLDRVLGCERVEGR